MPKGGPDGGDGGRGGHIYLVGSTQLWTLIHLKYQKHIIADSGNGGEGGRQRRRCGKTPAANTGRPRSGGAVARARRRSLKAAHRLW